jgi:hypothetical protein
VEAIDLDDSLRISLWNRFISTVSGFDLGHPLADDSRMPFRRVISRPCPDFIRPGSTAAQAVSGQGAVTAVGKLVAIGQLAASVAQPFSALSTRMQTDDD